MGDVLKINLNCKRKVLFNELFLNGLMSLFFLILSKFFLITFVMDVIFRVCSIARDRVKAMCNHFERVEQAVEFAVAIGHIFKTV